MRATVAVLLLAAAGAALWPASGTEATLPLFRRDASPYKRYSGLRASQDSARRVYLHDQTVAVVETSVDQRLLSCEFIEVYKPKEVADTLANLRNVSERAEEVSFGDMERLMSSCDGVDSPLDAPAADNGDHRGPRTFNAFSLLSGIVPGTKWCGVGDLADNYHDLGPEAKVDKCCRSHDICPVKVRGRDTRYNITNDGIVTRSHCECDQRLYECLKATGRPVADSMGTFYFNILRVQCVDDVAETAPCRAPEGCGPVRKFRRLRKRY